MTQGKLYLIPAPLGDGDPAEVIPAPVLAKACELDCFVVEELRTARRYLSRAGLKGRIDALEFHTLNEHTTPAEVRALLPLFEGGRDVGYLSEAGLPAVADPGASLVELCHEAGITVVPLSGPSSLLLALMGSGLNGQSFAFRGYLPIKEAERAKAIRELEKTSSALNQTQIFIETPYRNDALFAELLKGLSPTTRLCIAADLTLPTQTLLTRTAGDWRRKPFSIGKRPCVFLILAR